MREDAVMRILARIFRQADAVGRPLLHAFEDEVDTVRAAPRHPMSPRQHVVLLADPLLGPLDRDRMIARIGFHPALIVVRPLAQHLLADLGDADDVAEEVHHQLRSRQRRQIAVNDNAIEAVISTETGDAWLLDPSDYLAARLARDGDPESIALEETDTSFQIAWPGSYRLDGPAFVYTDRHSRHVSTILGNPTQLLAKD